METLNYKVLEGTGYNGYILKDAPVKVMQFGEGNFLRAFVDYFYDIANEKAGYNGKDVYKRQVFDGEGDKLRNKRIENHITVSVVIDMECGNTKN